MAQRFQYAVSFPRALGYMNASLVLHGTKQSSKSLPLRRICQKSKRNIFNVESDNLGAVEAIEIRRGFSFFCIDRWFIDYVEVINSTTNQEDKFQVYSSLKPWSSVFVWKTSLPQQNQLYLVREKRRQELEKQKAKYQLHILQQGVPPQILDVPNKEKFSLRYTVRLGLKLVGIELMAAYLKLCTYFSRQWKQLKQIENFYPKHIFPKPLGIDPWIQNEDINFGRQRIACVNSNVIQLCTKIPNNFPVQGKIERFLDNHTLQQAIEKKRLFIVNHEILKEIPTRSGFHVCAPIALFYLDRHDNLKPIAIQLYQTPSEDNPIFLPDHPKYTWMLAKMWFNNADTAYHQSITHLGLTHFLMDSLSVLTYRHLSPSHPLYKLLAPHYLFLMAIDNLAVEKLIGPGQWVDQTMNVGRNGMLELIRRRTIISEICDESGQLQRCLSQYRGWILYYILLYEADSIQNLLKSGKRTVAKAFNFAYRVMTWTFETAGTLPADLEKRGFQRNDGILPGYYFRDDALRLYDIIHKYVTHYVEHYYDCGKFLIGAAYRAGNAYFSGVHDSLASIKFLLSFHLCDDTLLSGDWELQNWIKAMAEPAEDGGAGLNDVLPAGQQKLESMESLVVILTSIIYTCSVGHAAANFQQYEEYAFPPGYPAYMAGKPPTSTDALNEQDVLKALPNKTTTISIMTITKLLSENLTNRLGNFEVEYIHDPGVTQVVERFREDLKKLGEQINNDNRERPLPYNWLNPAIIPNATSI